MINNLKCINRSTDGKSFHVKNIERFQREVIPKYFGHKNFSSFARQLNFYGFHKFTRKAALFNEVSNDYVTFRNPYFIDGNIELLKNIKRSTNNGNKALQRNKEGKERNPDMLGALTRRIEVLEANKTETEGQLLVMAKEIIMLQRQVNFLLQNSQKSVDAFKFEDGKPMYPPIFGYPQQPQLADHADYLVAKR